MLNPWHVFSNHLRKKKINPNSSSMVSPSQVPASSTLVQSIASSDKVKAEIRWAVKSVMSNFSNSSCNDINTLFKTMFLDSSIASNFAISEDKIRYMVNYGIAPYFKGLLIDEIKKSLCNSISFNESMNIKTQECRLDLVIRFWDEVNN